MAALDAAFWQQWAPNATISCLAASETLVCAALEYSDCVVLKVWPKQRCTTDKHDVDTSQAKELTGHADKVSCVAIHGSTLCTASADCVLLWRLSRAQEEIFVTRSMLVEKPRCEVSAMCFDASGTLVALVYHNQVEVITLHSRQVYITLEGHLAKITCCMFHPNQPHIFVTASEDRTFKVWDLAEQKLVYQSPILSAYAILSLTINPKTSDICCGFADGTVRIYQKYATELAVVPIGSMLARIEKQQRVVDYVDQTLQTTQNVVSSLPPWARSQEAIDSANARQALETIMTHPYADVPVADVVEISCPILSMHSVVVEVPETSVVEASHGIFIGTANYLVFLDSLSFEMHVVQAFQNEIPVPVRVAKQIVFTPFRHACECWVIGAFFPCVTRLHASVASKCAPPSACSSLSVHPLTSPPESSILLLPKLEPQGQTPKKKSDDKPVTFHARIKSSGYGPGKPKPKSSLSLKFKGLKKPATPPPSYLREYPTDSGLISSLDATKIKLHQGAINSVEYSKDGASLATAGNDRLAQVTTKSNSHVFVGHENYVKRIQWSHSSRFLLTSATDKSARVWCIGSDTSSIDIQPQADVGDAVFYYLDKFIALATSNRLKLYQYHVDEKHAGKQKRNDIERLENHSRTKCAATYTFESIKSLTSVACVNGVLSHLLAVAGSDKSVRIVDASVGKTLRVIPQAHATRAVHTVVMPPVSSYVSHPPNLHDLMLTAACDSAIHLWDIRTDNCVLRFGEHLNRVHSIGMAFSPCMRYVASGSEDKLTYMYDIRTGRTLVKLHGHTEVVSAVAFHPWRPRLATASVDGIVRYYNETQRARDE